MAALADDWTSWYEERRARVERAISAAMEIVKTPHSRLADAVQYAMAGGGKRLRPILVLETCEVCGGDEAAALPAAVAIECVHAFSLVHDDLPAMDDDDLRRGRATCHRAFDEATAILAGDWLLNHAYRLLSGAAPAAGGPEAPPAQDRLEADTTPPDRLEADTTPPDRLEADTTRPDRLEADTTRPGDRLKADTTGFANRLRADTAGGVCARLCAALAAGTAGMIAGQAADMEGERSEPNGGLATFIHEHKTAKLFEAACRMGAICAAGPAEPKWADAMGRFGLNLGLAFQMVDDLLDATGDSAALGKRAGKDAGAAKQTYPAIHGLEATRRRAAKCIEEAKAALAPFGDRASRLRGLADFVLSRDR